MIKILTHINLAMLIFSCSLLPAISASAVSFIAGGPVGISIIANHKIGSASSKLVWEAKR